MAEERQLLPYSNTGAFHNLRITLIQSVKTVYRKSITIGKVDFSTVLHLNKDLCGLTRHKSLQRSMLKFGCLSLFGGVSVSDPVCLLLLFFCCFFLFFVVVFFVVLFSRSVRSLEYFGIYHVLFLKKCRFMLGFHVNEPLSCLGRAAFRHFSVS